MKGKLLGKGEYVSLDNNTVFPNPLSEEIEQIEWRMRHAKQSVTEQDYNLVASVISAYRAMIIHQTQRSRNQTCEAMKKAIYKCEP